MANGDLPALMTRIGDDAAAAAGVLSRAGRAAKDAALRAAAGELRARGGQILSDNAADLGDARKASAGAALLDRLALDDARMPTLRERYKVPHYDAKGESNRVFAERGVPTTYLLTSAYWENLIYFGMGPKPAAHGRLALAFPTGDRKIPWIGAEDIGRCAYGIFKAGTAMIGKTIGVSGEHLSGTELAASLSRSLGVAVDYLAVKPDEYRALGFPGADDLGNMWQFKRDFNDSYRAARDINLARQLNPQLQRFDDWLRENARRIPRG